MEVDAPRGVVTLSRIFKWYGKDFAKDERSLLERISTEYDPKNEALREVLGKKGGGPKVRYAEYNWDVNSK